MVWNGVVPAITGSYNLNVSCGTGTACSAVTTAAYAAVAEGNWIGGFPQGNTNGSSNNNINIVVGNDPSICGSYSNSRSIPGACETTGPVNASGVATDATIYINAASLAGAQMLQDPTFLLSTLEHEMSHAFGVDDTYLHITQDSDDGLMSDGANSGVTWTNDLLLQSLIQTINSRSLTLGCLSPCPPGFVSAATTANPYPVPACELAPLAPILPSPPAPPDCTSVQLAAGWTNTAAGCVPAQGVVPISCNCTGSALSCTYSNGMTSSDPNNSECTGIPSCGSGTWNTVTQACACNAGYTWNPTTMNCEDSTHSINPSCVCQGNNLVCTHSDGSTDSNYNLSCAQQNSSSTPACNPDDPVASPDCPSSNNGNTPTSTNSDPNASCITNSQGLQQCTCNDGYYYPSGNSSLCSPVPDCLQTPGDPSCPGNMTYCQDNLNGAGCPPSDTTASSTNDNSDDYCAQDPSNSNCVSYCEQNYDAPACTGDSSTGDINNPGNDGGGSVGDGSNGGSGGDDGCSEVLGCDYGGLTQ